MRAQYALQAGDLRGRIERRINRVPVGFRKARMGDLLETHNAAALRGATASKKPASPAKSMNMAAVHVKSAFPSKASSPWRRTRRQR